MKIGPAGLLDGELGAFEHEIRRELWQNIAIWASCDDVTRKHIAIKNVDNYFMQVMHAAFEAGKKAQADETTAYFDRDNEIPF